MNQFEKVQFRGEFRDYQQRVLDRIDQYLADGKVNIVAAPGSGKTVLGLELIRRLGQGCIILSPTTAIRQQWGQRFRDLFLEDDESFNTLFSTDLHDVKLVNSITYQALYSAMNKCVPKDEEEDCSDIDLMQTIKLHQIQTICLDEAHHLKNEWQKALEQFLEQLDSDVKIIALTATPPYDSETTEWSRYYKICGEIDEEIFVPELVAQDTLCPHQDYIYFNYPTKEEAEVFDTHKYNAISAIREIGTMDAWGRIARWVQAKENRNLLFEYPREYIALLILMQHYKIQINKKLIKQLTTKSYLPELKMHFGERAIGFLISDNCSLLSEEEKELWIQILKKYDVYEKRKVTLALDENLKRTLIFSVGKLESIRQIAQNEIETMGDQLRMLVLTDYIKKENVGKIGTEEAFQSVNVVSIFETIRRIGAAANIGVLSGGLIILPDAIDLSGVKYKKEQIPGTSYCTVNLPGSNHDAVTFVGSLFESGQLQILIGTKSLLGEGWDAPCINSLILASFVGSFVQSNQMRGRAIRIDRENPDKTANIWHLVTVEPEHLFQENVMDEITAYLDRDKEVLESWDYEVLKRRFDYFMGPNYENGDIESGIDRVTIIKPPFDKKGIERINRQMLMLSSQRDEMRSIWQQELLHKKFDMVVETEIPRQKRVPAFFMIDWLSLLILILIEQQLIRMLSVIIMGSSASGGMQGLTLLVMAIVVLLGIWLLTNKAIKHISPIRSITAIGTAIYRTLKSCNLISSAASIHVEKGTKGMMFALQLRNATIQEQNLFNVAITELLSPIENPRYLLIRKNIFGQYKYYYAFACPTVIGKKKEYVEVLAKELKKCVGNMDLVYTHKEDGRRMILKCRQKSYISMNRQSDASVKRKYTVSHWE